MADDPVPDADCDLCEAARITPWFHEDDICWIAECEICAVPMVVWRSHGVDAAGAISSRTCTTKLAMVVAEHFTFEHYVDDNMRNIPDHYHAHARPAGRLLRSRAPTASRRIRRERTEPTTRHDRLHAVGGWCGGRGFGEVVPGRGLRYRPYLDGLRTVRGVSRCCVPCRVGRVQRRVYRRRHLFRVVGVLGDPDLVAGPGVGRPGPVAAVLSRVGCGGSCRPRW